MSSRFGFVGPGCRENFRGPVTRADIEKSWATSANIDPHTRSLRICMSGRDFTDDAMEEWCKWFKDHMQKQAGSREVQANEVNFAQNQLTSKGIRSMLSTLTLCRVKVRVLKLFQNKIASADGISEFIDKSEGSLHEMHLSHNLLTSEAAAGILASAAGARTSKGDYAYPWGKGNSSAPIWLRMEQNPLKADQFDRHVESALKKLHRPGRLICEVSGKTACNSRCCNAHSTPPAIHLTYLCLQGSKVLQHGGMQFPVNSGTGRVPTPQQTARDQPPAAADRDVTASGPSAFAREPPNNSSVSASSVSKTAGVEAALVVKDDDFPTLGLAPSPQNSTPGTSKEPSTWRRRKQPPGLETKAVEAASAPVVTDEHFPTLKQPAALETKAVDVAFGSVVTDEHFPTRKQSAALETKAVELAFGSVVTDEHFPTLGSPPALSNITPSTNWASQLRNKKSEAKSVGSEIRPTADRSAPVVTTENFPTLVPSPASRPSAKVKAVGGKKKKKHLDKSTSHGSETPFSASSLATESEKGFESLGQPADLTPVSACNVEVDGAVFTEVAAEEVVAEEVAAEEVGSRHIEVVAVSTYSAEADGYLTITAGDRLQALLDEPEEAVHGCRYTSYVFGRHANGSGWVPRETLWRCYADGDSGRMWAYDEATAAWQWVDELRDGTESSHSHQSHEDV